MNPRLLTAALGCAALALTACGEREDSNAANDAAATADGADATLDANGSAGGDTSATGSFPKGARIVEENGATYRVEADGTRVRLGENDSRIVVDNGVRYRVDSDGTRVRIDPDGASIDVDLPDVDVGINDKGNPDVDVKSKGDGNDGPD